MSYNDVKKQIVKQIQDTEKRVESFVRDLEIFMKRETERILNEIEDGNLDPAIALSGLFDALKQRGLDSKLNEIATLYGKEYKKAISIAKQSGLSLDGFVVDLTTVDALIRFKAEQIETRLMLQISGIKPQLLTNVVLGERFDMNLIESGLSAKEFANINTEMRTGLMGFNRTVNAIQAENAGLERFLYVGPDDDKIRDFCDEVLNERNPPVYSIDEIEAMDNGQGLDVHEFGGGYNCRHAWRAITPEIEEVLNA